jgi:hypothetical protein
MLYLYLIKNNAMNAYGQVEVNLCTFLTSTLNGEEQVTARTGRFKSGRRDPLYFGYKSGWAPEVFWTLRRKQNLCPSKDVKLRFFGRPTRSQAQPSRYSKVGWLPQCIYMELGVDETNKFTLFMLFIPCIFL